MLIIRRGLARAIRGVARCGKFGFVPFTQAAQVGGVADLSGFASTQSELTNQLLWSCNAQACPGMIRFGSTSHSAQFGRI